MQTTENDPAGVRVLEVRPWIDLAPYLSGFELVSLSLGPNGELYALAVTAPADYRYTAPLGASFPKVWTDNPHDVRILCVDGGHVAQRDIPDQHWNFSYAQPLPDDELLLVVSRSRCFADDVYDLNAKVYARDGALKREFLLGDGIRDVQATTDGRLWVSYFDEGIFGNFGGREPIGKPGLILWDRFGNRLFAYSPPKELEPYARMSSCDGLNVISDADVWCYYFDMAPSGTFPLISLREGRVASTWRCPVHGARGIALWQPYILFAGAYRKRDEYYLYELFDGGRIEHRMTFKAVNEDGIPLHGYRITARGSAIILTHESRLYRLDVGELVQTM
jgi:hypothetical protein